MKKSCKITLVYLIAIAAFFISCENDLKEVALLTQKGKLVPTEYSTQLNVLYTDSGAMQFRLKAPLMDHYLVGVKDPYSEFLKGVYIEHYGKDNTVKTTWETQPFNPFNQNKNLIYDKTEGIKTTE